MKKTIGVMLLIVLIGAILPGTVVAAPPAAEQTYTVQKDDNLWNISEKYLGNGALYRAIVYATNIASFKDKTIARIWKPALIQPGQKLIIPDAETAARLLAAPAPGELGSAEKPVQIYFVPSTEVGKIVAGGEVMRQAFEKITNLKFKVFVPTSYAAFVEGMCAAPGESMGFPATFAYVVANARCGVDASIRSVRYGDSFYYAQILVRRDSDIKTLQDLNGKKWGYTDPGSTSGYIVPLIQLRAAGVKVAEAVATGGHPQAVLAVYNGETDFGTTFFNPPQPAVAGIPKWKAGDDPEPYASVADECTLTADGKDIQCGNWLIKDARRNVRDTIPDVGQKVRILAISQPIPNDCMAFGPDFPLELRVKIELALMEFKETADWMKSIGDFYTWQDIIPTSDADYDGIRSQIEAAGFSMDEVVGLLGK